MTRTPATHPSLKRFFWETECGLSHCLRRHMESHSVLAATVDRFDGGWLAVVPGIKKAKITATLAEAKTACEAAYVLLRDREQGKAIMAKLIEITGAGLTLVDLPDRLNEEVVP